MEDDRSAGQCGALVLRGSREPGPAARAAVTLGAMESPAPWSGHRAQRGWQTVCGEIKRVKFRWPPRCAGRGGAGRGRPQAVTDPRSRPRSAARSTKRRASTGVGLLLPAAYAAASHSPIGCTLTESTFDWGKTS